MKIWIKIYTKYFTDQIYGILQIGQTGASCHTFCFKILYFLHSIFRKVKVLSEPLATIEQKFINLQNLRVCRIYKFTKFSNLQYLQNLLIEKNFKN